MSTWLASCRTPPPAQPVAPSPRSSPVLVTPAVDGARPTIAIGKQPDGALSLLLPDARIANAAATITELSASDTAALVARMAKLPDLTETNANAPALPPKTPPPPRAGTTTPIAFAMPTGKAVGATPPAMPPAPQQPRALVPPDISPSGAVTRESTIRVRFAEPMVPVAQLGPVATPPVTIAPAIAGTWRWLDTRVLEFTARAPRFPQATAFTVRVAAGVRAVSGATLAETIEGTFSTATVSLEALFPSRHPVRTDAPIAIAFDQEIDPAAIAPLLSATDGRRKIPLRVVTLAEAAPLWAKSQRVGFVAADAAGVQKLLGKHHLIVAPVGGWPAGKSVRLALAAKAPSKEGALTSERPSLLDFDVVAPFRVVDVECGTLDENRKPRIAGITCPAESSLVVTFSTPLDDKTYAAKQVQIEGQPLQDHAPNGSYVPLTVPAVPGKQHAIVIDDKLVDGDGQPLVGPRRIAFRTTQPQWEPELHSEQTGMTVLDPRFQIPQWVVSAAAVKQVRVQLYRVEPKDYFAFEKLRAQKLAAPPGKRMFEQTYEIGAKLGANVRVDLRPALDASGLGHVLAIAIATEVRPGQPPRDARIVTWLQVTKLGLSARFDGERIHSWVHDLAPNRLFVPIAGVTTSLVVDGRKDATASDKTDPNGLTALPLLPRRVPKSQSVLVATAGADSTFLAVDDYEQAIRVRDSLWYVTDDRFTYRPGEPVHVKGWVRWTDDGVHPAVVLPAASETVNWVLSDKRGVRLGGGSAKLTDQGGFDLEVKLPPTTNLGTATFAFEIVGRRDPRNDDEVEHRHTIAVQEFRTPAFAVALNDDVTHAGARPLLVGETIEMSATASYFSGGGLPDASVRWVATLVESTYRPQGWDAFDFDPVRPRDERRYRYGYNEKWVRERIAGVLDGSSTSGVVVGITAVPANRPSLLSVEATVVDVDRQRIRAGSRSIVVHPSAYYVGLAKQRDDVLDVIVTDIDGKAVAGVPVTVELEAVLGSERYDEAPKVVDRQSCKITSALQPVACSYARKDRQWAYTARATVTDARGRVATAQYDVPWWTPSTDDFAIVADRPLYRPGDVAKLTIHSKTFPATAIVTFARNGVIAQQRVELVGPTTPVTLPIQASYVKNIHVAVDRYLPRDRLRPGSTQPLPAHDETELELDVDMEALRLAVTAQATTKIIEPGDHATFEIAVAHAGKPKANAEVALIVVDEAVLSVSGRKYADPLAPFVRAVRAGHSLESTLDLIEDLGPHVAAKPGVERFALGSYGRGRGGMRGRSAAVPTVSIGQPNANGGAPRQDFRPNAVFAPRLRTDATGKARVTVKMPDSLTRYRIVAIATSDTHYFGKGENTIVAQRKINARTVAPRFATVGDTFDVPVVVQNLDAAPRTIDVVARAANLTSVGATGKRVTVPAGQRVELRFGFATVGRGRAAIQTLASAGAFVDSSIVEIPVYVPATTESFAAYGVVDDVPQFEQLAVPRDIWPAVGGVEVELASTQMQSLTDAYWYLQAYPYECNEQRSSRVLATTALYDILEAFAAPGRPSRQKLDAQRATDIRVLAREQKPDGGWGYFTDTPTDEYVSLQVLAALAGLARAGQQVDADVVQRGTAYATKLVDKQLAALEAIAKGGATKPADQLRYSVGITAAGLTALASTKLDARPRAERLHAAATALAAYPIDAQARVLAILAKLDRAKVARGKLVTALQSATRETASSATVTVPREAFEVERLLHVTSTKTTALALEALIREVPAHALIPKLARGLLDARRAGRWRTTQENLAVLQAMRRYFDAYEKLAPSFTGKAWLGTAAYAEQAFVGRDGARGIAGATWSALAPGATHDLAFAKTGTGRMYYRVGITYAPAQRDLPALDAGFVVRRSYTGAENPADVQQLPDGRIRVKLGAKVLVAIETTNTTLRHTVAVVDPLPAGFEIIDSSLATSEASGVAVEPEWDHENLRDHRAEVFAMQLREGTHRYVYAVRATTPGTFVAAPAKAEEMYTPETFGRSTGAVVVVE